jgi:hypothetical protein
MMPDRRDTKRCNGSGLIYGLLPFGHKPCPGCDHPDCPNRVETDPPEQARRGGRDHRAAQMQCARPGCSEAEDRIDGYCSVYCRDIHDLEQERERATEERGEAYAGLGGRETVRAAQLKRELEVAMERIEVAEVVADERVRKTREEYQALLDAAVTRAEAAERALTEALADDAEARLEALQQRVLEVERALRTRAQLAEIRSAEAIMPDGLLELADQLAQALKEGS